MSFTSHVIGLCMCCYYTATGLLVMVKNTLCQIIKFFIPVYGGEESI